MKIIISGAYAIGTYLAKLLSRDKQDIVLMDENPENLAKISNDYDLLTMESSPTSIKGLKTAGIEDADLFIAVTPMSLQTFQPVLWRISWVQRRLLPV